MSTEVLVVLLTTILGFVHLFLPAIFATLQNGPMSGFTARDDAAPVENVLGQRAARANINFHETVPFALAIFVLVAALKVGNGTSAMGAWIYFGARVLYLPLYVFGVPYVRTVAWATSLAGIAIAATPLFM